MARLFLILAALFTLSTTAAHADSSRCPLPLKRAKLCASISWDSAPATGRANAFTLRFWDLKTGSESGPYITPAQAPFVRLWMPSMGHGSRPVVISSAREGGAELPGVFRVEQVFFSMPGDWDVQVQLRSGSQVADQAVLSLDL